MNRKYILIILLSVMLALTKTTFSGTAYNSVAGKPLIIDASANIPGTDPFVFHPSPFGFVAANTSSDCFAASAVNRSSLGIEGGMEYGIAADSNHIFYRSVYERSQLTIPSTSTSDAFIDYSH